MKLALFIFALPLFAQTSIQINVGGQPTGTYSGDTVCGGTNYLLAGQPGIYSTLKYGFAGAPFSCDIPAPNGSCVATLDLIENRAAGPNAATDSAVGTRIFTASLQGVASAPIDIFAAVGDLRPYQLPLAPAIIADGHLRLAFAASRGNAVLAGLDIACTPAPPPALGVPCASLTPSTGVVLVISLKDGSCLPVTMLAAPSVNPGDIQAVWFNANSAGVLAGQSLFSSLPAIPITQ